MNHVVFVGVAGMGCVGILVYAYFQFRNFMRAKIKMEQEILAFDFSDPDWEHRAMNIRAQHYHISSDFVSAMITALVVFVLLVSVIAFQILRGG